MKIPKTTHKKLKYRNGETGLLLTSIRKNTQLCVMSIREQYGCIIHHRADGRYLNMDEEHGLDIVWVEGAEEQEEFENERGVCYG